MDALKKRICAATAANKHEYARALLITYVWGLVAHGYMLLNYSFTHDSLRELYATPEIMERKAEVGRFLVPAYQYLFRGDMSYPWLTGLLSLLYIGTAVFLVCKVFQIRKPLGVVLVSGIFTVNVTVIAAIGTYIHDLDVDMLAMLLAVTAVFLWRKYRWGFWAGILPIGLLLGLYQSYMSTAITLIIIVCLMDLLEGKTFSQVMSAGLKSVVMLIGGGILYLVMLRSMSVVFSVKVSSGEYNSMDLIFSTTPQRLLELVAEVWQFTLKFMYRPASAFGYFKTKYMHLALRWLICIPILLKLLSRSTGWLERLLAVALLAVLPLGMNIAKVLTLGMSHDLMHYALWMQYLLAFLVGRWFVQSYDLFPVCIRQAVNGVALVLIAVILWGNVRVANEAYVIKDLEKEAMMSYMTRVLDRVEDHADYQHGITPVAFVGEPEGILQSVPNNQLLDTLLGAASSYVWWRMPEYFQYILLNDAKVLTGRECDAIATTQVVQEMPAYPAEGCIRLIDGVIVVKLGDLAED